MAIAEARASPPSARATPELPHRDRRLQGAAKAASTQTGTPGLRSPREARSRRQRQPRRDRGAARCRSSLRSLSIRNAGAKTGTNGSPRRLRSIATSRRGGRSPPAGNHSRMRDADRSGSAHFKWSASPSPQGLREGGGVMQRGKAKRQAASPRAAVPLQQPKRKRALAIERRLWRRLRSFAKRLL
jgi:hypothetical protein